MTTSMIKAVIALGNPGLEYEKTRHNIGWMSIEHLPFANSLSWLKKFKGVYSTHSVSREKVYFLKPLTYMNLSGESAVEFMNFFKISVDEILVVHDELDFPYGQLALKKGGGLAGHNGLKSLTSCLGTQDFWRLRLGIGKPVHGSVSSWVLSPFGKEEQGSLEEFLKGAAQATECCLTDGPEKAMQKYNKKQYAQNK